VNITIRCKDHNDDLETKWYYTTQGEPILEVSPCEKCIKGAESEAYDLGHDEGYDEDVDESNE